MVKRYFITPDFIRASSNISTNMQDKFLETCIAEASDIDLNETIGDKLYNDLSNMIGNKTIDKPENEKYKNLLGIIKYFLEYCVLSRIIIVSSIKLDNAGANQSTDEHIEAVSVDDCFHLEQYYRKKADYYKKKVQKYICK